MLRTSEGFDRLELRVSGRICVLARMGAHGFDGLSHDVTWHAWRRFEQLSLDQNSAAALRTFWSRHSTRRLTKRLSDRELQIEVARAVRQGALSAAVFVDPGPQIHARELPAHSGPMPHPAEQVSSASSKPGAPPPLARPGLAAPAPLVGPAAPVTPAAPSAAAFDPAWTLAQKINIVVRIAAGQLPKALGDQLLGLISPENIGIMVAGFAIAVAAHFGGVGEVADVVLGGLALAFGGWAAVGALKDLWTAARLTVRAESAKDLADAGAALAAAVSILGVLGLFAILHTLKTRAGGAAEEGAAPKAAKAPPEKASPPPPPREKPAPSAPDTKASKPAAAEALEAEHPLKGWSVSEVLAHAEKLGFATEKDSLVLWSGLGDGGPAKAASFAKANGGTTLEMTPGGSWLNGMEWGENSPFTRAEARQIWDGASGSVVQQASGDVRAVVGKVSEESTFVRIELQAAANNPNITSLNLVRLPGN